MTLPLPIWPGWHRMPPPFTVRWSWEAWEAAYGQPGDPHWREWPHEEEFRQQARREFFDLYQIPQALRDAWNEIAAE